MEKKKVGTYRTEKSNEKKKILELKKVLGHLHGSVKCPALGFMISRFVALSQALC